MYKPSQSRRAPADMMQGATPRNMLPPTRTTFDGKKYSTPYVPSSFNPSQTTEYDLTIGQNVPTVSYPWWGENQKVWNQQQYGNPYAYSTTQNNNNSTGFLSNIPDSIKLLGTLAVLGTLGYLIYTRKI